MRGKNCAFRPSIEVLHASATLTLLVSTILLLGCAGGRERVDAEIVAARVHDDMRAGSFASVYQQSAPRFKSVGSEAEFVANMKDIEAKLGQLKDANAVAYQTSLDSRIGWTHVLLFDLNYEHGRARETMTLVRSDRGEMQLWKLSIQPV